MTVAELIQALQEVPNQEAIVNVQSAVGGTGSALLTVDISAATNATFPADAPEAGGNDDPGVVELRDVA